MSKHIDSPRPLWSDKEAEGSPNKDVIIMGTATSGVVMRITKSGIELNGYYAGAGSERKYALLRNFAEMTWQDLEKAREMVLRPGKRTANKPKTPPKADYEKEFDKEYLSKLPIVTLNGARYYIDLNSQTRMPVDQPNQVFKLDKVLRTK
jgi:hypothetical protein